MCQSSYATDMKRETRELSVTQVVDINNCREKAARYTGMATTVLDNVSKQVRSPHSTAELSRTYALSILTPVLILCVLPSRREILSCRQ